MKKSLLLAALPLVCACYEDPSAEELLVGTWSSQSSFGTSTMTFAADGTFTSRFDGGGPVSVSFNDWTEAGTFEVDGTTLRQRGTQQNGNEFSRETLLAVDQTTLVLDILAAEGKVKGALGIWVGRKRQSQTGGHGQRFETGRDSRLTIAADGQIELYESSFEGEASNEQTMTGTYQLADGGKLQAELAFTFEGFEGPTTSVHSVGFILVSERALSFEPTFGLFTRVE